MMNRYVRLYAETRNDHPHLDRYVVYKITTGTIAELGTIEDLRALEEYFKKEYSRAANATK